MKRFLAFGFLVLFLFSTTATYASVHLCKGQITDIAILSGASCDHEHDIVDHHSEETCCKSHNKEKPAPVHKCFDQQNDCKQGKDGDCCQTEELNAVKSIVTTIANDKLKLSAKSLPSFSDFYFENHRVLRKTYGLAYVPPLIERDITIEVQCFRI